MRIIFIGAPGTGKGTQAQWITDKYNIPKISTGDILRNETLKKTELSKKIKKIISCGKLINDNIVIQLIRKRIKEKDCNQGFLLDGFPRTVNQANAIEKINVKIDCIIEFSLTEKLILERIRGRRIHIESGRIYHIIFNPPIVENKDNITGQPLIIRDDDKEEKIKKRIKEYKKFTIPLIKYYRHTAKLNNIKYYKIDASYTTLEIKKNIENIIKNNVLK
ncbi:adenylate kinase [Buchnera aphidicola (Pemphigus obesinymphae)]|uniref:adenylate kinase n=1 Tax=Buchnera aphidicola TaxID=9 RepID=UPI002237A06D|nr:adenylate kinase [Buchnera aphidicola]MCW5196386.1 adenylate kinase [Buchnera aphidicola (Pemphigus obesinymphae)]